jgi:hypothetical protein
MSWTFNQWKEKLFYLSLVVGGAITLMTGALCPAGVPAILGLAWLLNQRRQAAPAHDAHSHGHDGHATHHDPPADDAHPTGH